MTSKDSFWSGDDVVYIVLDKHDQIYLYIAKTSKSTVLKLTDRSTWTHYAEFDTISTRRKPPANLGRVHLYKEEI